MATIQKKLFQMRTQFSMSTLEEKQLSKNPILQFQKWMKNAIDAEVHEPNAMTLATADKSGNVDARIVLLRNVNKEGFSFFTNYLSAKGNEMKSNKNVCLNFFWPELQRQVRIKGTVSKLPAKASDNYFNSRPRESQIGAWASHQSEKLASRQDLEVRVIEVEDQFLGQKVPRPPHWGGYVVKPKQIEFWQGRQNRLHDRIVFTYSKGGWKMSRLNP